MSQFLAFAELELCGLNATLWQTMALGPEGIALDSLFWLVSVCLANGWALEAEEFHGSPGPLRTLNG